jgi:uncharacterized protein (TIGR04222 family)
MNWNPFDWTAGPFLALYSASAVVLFLIGSRLKSMIGPAAQANRRLSELELAYLAGGARRLGDAALLCLTANKGATIDSRGHEINVTNLTPLAALMSRPLDLSFASDMTRERFQMAIAPLAARVRGRLQAIGYCPTETQVMSFRVSVLPFFGLLIAFGIMKAIIGIERHHPIGFLIMLMLFTAVAAIVVAKSPARTQAGNEALRDHRAKHARASRAPRDHELLLAVALSGPVVLAGTAHAPVYAASRTMSSSGGGSGCSSGGSGCSSGGGGGGGGCGGCS